MRPLKYRAWVKPAKCHKHSYMATILSMEWNVWPLPQGKEVCMVVVPNPVGGDDDWKLDMSEVELMQYTGLKDVDGVEIYEGDVVSYSYESEDDAYMDKAIVKYDNNVCGFWPFVKGSCWRADIKNVKVLGNVFENPELRPEKEGGMICYD